MAEIPQAPAILRLTAEIVVAQVAKNAPSVEALPQLITSVYQALSSAGAVAPAAEKLEPAVPVKKSVQADYILCLEDGAKLKMLKRYLATRYQMTPEQYRTRWGLSPDYPMVAPNYTERRSVLAKQIGLGRKAAASSEVAEGKPVATPKRGRKKAA